MTSEYHNTPDRDVKGFFKTLSTVYARQTGDSTFNLVYSFLSKLPVSVLSSNAIIHDNACGVGAATSAILLLTQDSPPKRIEATDSSEGMISQLQSKITASPGSEGWSTIHAAVHDSHSLPFQNDEFTLSITNISVTNFRVPAKCLTEVHRTLTPGGLAIVSIWKRFAVADMIHQAQRAIKGPDVEVMKVPQREFFEQGHLRRKMVEAGFKDVKEKVEVTVLKDEAIEGIKEFMCGDFTRSAKIGWSEEEKEKWNGVIEDVLKEEIRSNNGVKMEAWFVTGTK